MQQNKLGNYFYINMNNADFWASINAVIEEGFTSEGLQKLYAYAEDFISGRLVYKRFSSLEQYGCSTGGFANVIATLLAGAEIIADCESEKSLTEYQRECKRGAQQEKSIEQWARAEGIWIEPVDDSLQQLLGARIAEGGEAVVYDNGTTLVKSIGLDYFILPALALDRIALHNAYFPETRLKVLGFGRNTKGDFEIIVEQPFIKGLHISDEKIEDFMKSMGFELKNPRNWTYATPEIYLSDMHDENVLCSANGTVFVIDCDIRINTPELRQGGVRMLTTEVVYN